MCVCVPVEQKVNKRPVGAIMSPPRHWKTELIEMSPLPHTCNYISMYTHRNTQKLSGTVPSRQAAVSKSELFVSNVCVKECVRAEGLLCGRTGPLSLCLRMTSHGTDGRNHDERTKERVTP